MRLVKKKNYNNLKKTIYNNLHSLLDMFDKVTSSFIERLHFSKQLKMKTK